MDILDAKGLTEEQFLAQYDPGNYPRPSVTVDIVVFTVANLPEDRDPKPTEKELRILLIRRGGHPYLGHWALPGGFVNPGETVGEAAKRELAEETGVQDGNPEQFYTFSKPGRDPRTWVISCAHMSLIPQDKISLHAGDDAEDARWFTLHADCSEQYTEIALSNGDLRLSARLRRESAREEWRTERNQGLAFDHAEIIACALQRLREKPALKYWW